VGAHRCTIMKNYVAFNPKLIKVRLFCCAIFLATRGVVCDRIFLPEEERNRIEYSTAMFFS